MERLWIHTTLTSLIQPLVQYFTETKTAFQRSNRGFVKGEQFHQACFLLLLLVPLNLGNWFPKLYKAWFMSVHLPCIKTCRSTATVRSLPPKNPWEQRTLETYIRDGDPHPILLDILCLEYALFDSLPQWAVCWVGADQRVTGVESGTLEEGQVWTQAPAITPGMQFNSN